VHTNSSQNTELNTTEFLPKTFLQLKGISVANYNMGCNFSITAAIRLMVQYELSILAIQEHTPWNKTLSEPELNSIQRTCDKWGYLISIAKLQLTIIDKQLASCYRGTTTSEDGRIINSRFEHSHGSFVNFTAIYAIPHTSNSTRRSTPTQATDHTHLEKMESIQQHLRNSITKATRNNELTYVYGDLQDTPDNSKIFHYGSCRIPKHPLGVIHLCESLGFQCTIYQHLHSMEKPIISHHGSKGGRFIDSMYTSDDGLVFVRGITIVQDTGILSDHDMVINKIDLGIETPAPNLEKEERINFGQIMNIPVIIKPGHNHPVINDSVYKRTEYKTYEKLYLDLQETITKSPTNHISNIQEVMKDLQSFESELIHRTLATISPEDQQAGKLIQRLP
jgi:hypothetical protein